MTIRLSHFTPLPPAQNGIADYASRVIAAMAGDYPSVVYSDTVGGRAPAGAAVRPLTAAPARLSRNQVALYQIGNNPQHVGVLRRALTHPGVAVLHDLNLLYLYQCAGSSPEALAAVMGRSNPWIGQAATLAMARGEREGSLHYSLFNALADVVQASHNVVVHSEFARTLIGRHLGDDALTRTVVIPHFAIASEVRDRAGERTRLGVAEDDILVVTAGFVTQAKQFDLVMDALSPLAAADRRVRWIHAGEAGDLADRLAARPDLARAARLTGYVSEAVLDAHIASSDIFVNLRFPSVGESSGSLARAFDAGVCAVVSDTGAYAELPGDVVLKIPTTGGRQALSAVLGYLISHPEVRQGFAERARRFARTELSISAYRDRLGQVIHSAAMVSGRRSP